MALRQILTEAADRFNFTSTFRNIKALKIQKPDVQPFSLAEVQQILATARADYRNYLTVRFFTGMRTGARDRAFKVIAKIPKVDPVRFESVLRGSDTQDRRHDGIAEEFRDLLFSGVQGAFAVRELPELMVAVAADYLLATEDAVQDDGYHGHTLDIDIHFGITEGLRRDFFPASALRGPWISLLTLHPRTGLEFYYRVFNQSIDWYTHPRIANPLEPAWEIELTFADGSVQKQWVNGRLSSQLRALDHQVRSTPSCGSKPARSGRRHRR
jgi:hypothetical protein